MSSEVVAILASDIHLSHKVPSARSAEPDWYSAMERPLRQVRGLMNEFDVPLVIAGDIFDRWNSPPELINFAMDVLPKCYAIPGQHDLPNHSLEEMHRSAYGTMVMAGRILGGRGRTTISSQDKAVHLCGFPWGCDIEPFECGKDDLSVAVVHQYVYSIPGSAYPGAPPEGNLVGWGKQLVDYDAAVFGDNHKGFTYKAGECNVMNCGTLMRRKLDERDYSPMVGILYSDGTIKPYVLDCAEDKWATDEEMFTHIEREINLRGFVDSLETLQSDALDFRHAIRHALDRLKVSPPVRKKVLEVTGG